MGKGELTMIIQDTWFWGNNESVTIEFTTTTSDKYRTLLIPYEKLPELVNGLSKHLDKPTANESRTRGLFVCKCTTLSLFFIIILMIWVVFL